MNRHATFFRSLPVLALCALALLAPSAAAGVDLGLRGGYYFDVDEPFAGVELITPVARRIYFNPNLEWVFTEGFDYLTLNGDFHYDFPVRGSQFVWAGAGLGLVRVDPEGPGEGDTDPALNLLAGIGFRAGGLIPYFQGKLIVKDDTAFVFAFGVRF
jgi:hypothetical protein